MKNFSYRALETTGGVVAGTVAAHSRAEAYKKIEATGLHPLSVEDGEGASASRGDRGGKQSLSGEKPRLSSKQILFFTEELSDLLDAGIPVEPALKILERRASDAVIGAVCGHLRTLVREGASLSDALPAACPSFDGLYRRMVAAGEASGALPKILKRQAEHLAAVAELRNALIQGLIYPAFITFAGLALMLVFLLFLVPQLEGLFSRTGGAMPLPTRILIGVSRVIVEKWWMGGVGIVVGSLVFWRWTATEKGRAQWDKTKARIPFIGRVLMTKFYAQFANTLATLLHNGVPLHPALQLLQGSATNTHIATMLESITGWVGGGLPLSKAFEKSKEVPPMLTDLVSVGEQTGDLASALAKASRRYEKELQIGIKRLTALIQPVIISLLALVVLAIAYSMLAGIFQAISSLRR